MKTLLITLLLAGMAGNTLIAENPRPAKRSTTNARKAAFGKPQTPTRSARLLRS